MKSKMILFSIFVTCVTATQAASQSTHDHTAMHPATPSQTLLQEPGQGAFAAISEVVALLLADPSTDWSTVDIDALRQHLVDMDNLVTHAQVQSSPVTDGVEFTLPLTGAGWGAVERMVPVHAPVLNAETGWASEVTRTGNELVWRVSDEAAADAIRALGFFGLMAVGDHHRSHHLGLAMGEMVH